MNAQQANLQSKNNSENWKNQERSRIWTNINTAIHKGLFRANMTFTPEHEPLIDELCVEFAELGYRCVKIPNEQWIKIDWLL